MEGGTARFVFDPEQARITPTVDVPLVDFGDRGRALADAWEIRRRWLDEADRRDLAFQEYAEQEGTYEGFEYDMSDLRVYLLGKMSGAKHRAVRRYAAVAMADLLDMGTPLEEEETEHQRTERR